MMMRPYPATPPCIGVMRCFLPRGAVGCVCQAAFDYNNFGLAWDFWSLPSRTLSVFSWEQRPPMRGKFEAKKYNDEGTSVLAAFAAHQIPLKRFIARFMRNTSDVEDIAQETFLRAFSVEQGRPIEQPKSFLYRIAKHIALNQLKQKSRQITCYIEDSCASDVIPLEGSAEEEAIAGQTLGLHCDAVASLPPQCRQAYLLRKVHGLSHKEIAEHLGIAVSTVEKHLMKGVEQCDRFIAERTALRDLEEPVSPAQERRA